MTRLEIVFVDVLVIVALHAIRKARVGARSVVGVEAILRAVLDNDTTGIVVLNRNGRTLYVSREAERICGPELRSGQGFEPLSTVRLASADGQAIAVHDIFAEFDPASVRANPEWTRVTAPDSVSRQHRDLLVVRNGDQRLWIECQAVPVRVGPKRAALIALLMWDNQARHRQQMEASLDETLRQRREDRDALLNEISRHLRGSLDARHIQRLRRKSSARAQRRPVLLPAVPRGIPQRRRRPAMERPGDTGEGS